MKLEEHEYQINSSNPFNAWVSAKIIQERLSANSYSIDFLRLKEKKLKSRYSYKKISDLAEVSAMIGWKGLTTDNYVKTGGTYLLRTVDIKDGFVSLDNAIMAEPEKVIEQPQIILKPGDIVFSKDGNTLGLGAVVPETIDDDLCVGSSLARIRLRYAEETDSYYVLMCLLSRFTRSQISYFITGSAQPHLNQEYIRQLEIPFVPYYIQSFIGSKVRQAERLMEEARRLKNEAEELLTIGLKMEKLKKKIGGLGSEKHNWTLPHERLDAEFYKRKYEVLRIFLDDLNNQGLMIKRLEEVRVSGNYGILPKSSDYGNGETLLIRSTDLSNYLISFDACEKVPDEYYNSKAIANPGDVLMEIKGAISGGAIVPDIVPPSIINGSIFKFSVLSGYNNYYILAVLQSLIGGLQKAQYSANSVISYLSIDIINNLRIPILPQKDQNEIGERLRKYSTNIILAKNLIKQAKQNVEDLIEGKFDEFKIQVEG